MRWPRGLLLLLCWCSWREARYAAAAAAAGWLLATVWAIARKMAILHARVADDVGALCKITRKQAHGNHAGAQLARQNTSCSNADLQEQHARHTKQRYCTQTQHTAHVITRHAKHMLFHLSLDCFFAAQQRNMRAADTQHACSCSSPA
jgi:hypothetical protein